MSQQIYFLNLSQFIFQCQCMLLFRLHRNHVCLLFFKMFTAIKVAEVYLAENVKNSEYRQAIDRYKHFRYHYFYHFDQEFNVMIPVQHLCFPLSCLSNGSSHKDFVVKNCIELSSVLSSVVYKLRLSSESYPNVY